MAKNRVKPLIGAGLSKGSFISFSYATLLLFVQPNPLLQPDSTPMMQIIRQ